MSRWVNGLILLGLLLSGCIYKVPFVSEHTIPVDPAVLGLWELNEQGEKPEQMLVLKYSDTEYLVHYPVAPDGMYFRAYPIKVGDVAAVQIQLIGTAEGVVSDEERTYQLVAYTLTNGELETRTLNSDLVDKELPTSGALVEALLKNKDNKELFREPGRFKKVVPKN